MFLTGAKPRRGIPRAATWVEPEPVAQIAFMEWTRDGRLPHPSFLGLRFDKPAREVVREGPNRSTDQRPPGQSEVKLSRPVAASSVRSRRLAGGRRDARWPHGSGSGAAGQAVGYSPLG
jgi:bifunctional non-homologous end joining protein LigD